VRKSKIPHPSFFDRRDDHPPVLRFSTAVYTALDIEAKEPFLLVAQWLGGSSKATDDLEEWRLGTDPTYLLHFMDRRIGKLRERVLAGVAGPLLSAPTHEGGWIDAPILVERWCEIERLAREPDPLDVIQALLRLAPDRRSDAMRAARKLSHRFAAALRWAQGADEASPKLDADSGPVWIAAARARVPQGNVPGTENWTGEMASLATARATRRLPETVLAIDDKLPIWEDMAAYAVHDRVVIRDRSSFASLCSSVVTGLILGGPGGLSRFLRG
jgi:hypothetical protein